jgi:transposase
MGFEAEKLTSQHFWDQMNRVPVEALGEIEERVLTRLVELERLAIEACVYDTTNFYTYIATENSRSELAQRGHNKQKRHDLRQFGLALVVDRSSQLPLFHHLYSGQKNDARTLGELIAPIRRRLKKLRTEPEQLTFIFDAGANSSRNLQELKAHYVVVLRSSDHRKWLSEVASQLETITLSNGEKVPAYRQSKVVLRQKREVVAFISPSLQEGQRRGLLQHLKKIAPELEKIGLHSRYLIPTLEKRLQKLLDRQYIRHLIHYELSESPEGGTDLRFWSDLEEYRRLQNRYFGFRILATDHSDWTTEEIIEAHRSQPRS